MFKQTQVKEAGIIKRINGNRTTIELLKQTAENCKSCSGCAEVKGFNIRFTESGVKGNSQLLNFVNTQNSIITS